MSQDHSPVGLSSFSPRSEKLQSAEKLEEGRQNYQYPSKIQELQALQGWHTKGSEANFYKSFELFTIPHSPFPF